MVDKNKKAVDFNETLQRIVGGSFKEDVAFEPKDVENFYVDNKFLRTLAHLIGNSSNGAKRLVCTTAGVLKVASIGTGFENNDTISGAAPDAYGAIAEFDVTVSRVDVWVNDFGLTIKRSIDGVLWQDEIELPANTAYSFDGSTVKMDVKNTTPGSVSNYQIVGWS